MKPNFLIAAGLLFVPPAWLNAKDLGMFNGEPTPALAMYAAQTQFASDKCVSEGLTKDAKGAANFLKYFNRGIQLSLYRKKDAEFVANLNTYLSMYNSAWDASEPKIHQQFCNDFGTDIDSKSGGFIRWMTQLNYFRNKFSPISDASEKRRQKMALFASAAGGAVTTAGGFAAGHDAVSSAKAGDFAKSNLQMAEMRNINQLGLALVKSAPDMSSHANELTSVLEEKNPDGTVQIVRCAVVDHFFSFSAPLKSTIWTTYQRVSMACRDPIASDLRRAD